MFIITQATEKDLTDIIDIAERTWWPAYSSILSAQQIRYMLDTIYALETMRKEMLNGTQTYLLLKDQNGSAAFASYGRRFEEIGVHKLHKLYVLPENQEKGYGGALLEEIKNRLLKDNFHILDLNVNRYNAARKFYEKNGFTVLREENIPIGPYWMNDYVMRTVF